VRQLSIENVLLADTRQRVCVVDKKIPSKESVEAHGNIQDCTIPYQHLILSSSKMLHITKWLYCCERFAPYINTYYRVVSFSILK
jgi:hypothetical protein